MKRWLALATAAVCAVFLAPIPRAGATPAGAPSRGTASVLLDSAPGVDALTLTGSIAVGPDEFTGTATGSMPNKHGSGGLYFYSQRIIDAFALQGPDLTGTCSGHWLYGRWTESPLFTGTGLAPSPVAAISLSCTLQLGHGAPAETELVIALVNDSNSPSRHLTGAYGPGPSVLADISPLSEGTADVYTEGYGAGYRIEYRFVGDIVFGGRVFQGVAGGSYGYQGEPAPSFSLTGTSPTGDLSASCVDIVSSALAFEVGDIDTGLVCTGSVGSGPASTVRLLVETPLGTTYQSGRYSASDGAGAFFEYPVALPS